MVRAELKSQAFVPRKHSPLLAALRKRGIHPDNGLRPGGWQAEDSHFYHFCPVQEGQEHARPYAVQSYGRRLKPLARTTGEFSPGV